MKNEELKKLEDFGQFNIVNEVIEDDFDSFIISDDETNNVDNTERVIQQTTTEVEDISFDTIPEMEEPQVNRIISEGSEVNDITFDTITDESFNQETEKQKVVSDIKEVDEEVDTLPEDFVEYQKISKETGLVEQIDEDLGDIDLNAAEECFRQTEKDKLVNEEADVRAEEKAQVIVNQTIRSATEVLNKQNLLATREAEQNIRERQYRLEQKIKKNKHRDIRSKIGSTIFMACLIVGLYVCYSNPTLNKGIRSVLSSTLTMFSDLIAGKEVNSNDIVNSLGNELNENTMKYEYKLVDENGNEITE